MHYSLFTNWANKAQHWCTLCFSLSLVLNSVDVQLQCVRDEFTSKFAVFRHCLKTFHQNVAISALPLLVEWHPVSKIKPVPLIPKSSVPECVRGGRKNLELANPGSREKWPTNRGFGGWFCLRPRIPSVTWLLATVAPSILTSAHPTACFLLWQEKPSLEVAL